jgi:hypothetical protein
MHGWVTVYAETRHCLPDMILTGALDLHLQNRCMTCSTAEEYSYIRQIRK